MGQCEMLADTAGGQRVVPQGLAFKIAAFALVESLECRR